MFPLPALPLVPKLHRFFEPEQTKTFALVFGIALLGQFLLPWPGPGWFLFGGPTIWPLLAGVAFLVFTFVPGLADKLPGNTFFVIAAGIGFIGLGFSFAGVFPIPFIFWFTGFGVLGIAALCTGLFLWARNGYDNLYWVLVVSGLGGLLLSLLIPMGIHGFPLVAIFSQIGGMGLGFFGVLGGILSCVLSLAFIGALVLLVMNVVLKKGDADQAQVERFGSTIFVSALLFPFVAAFFAMPMFSGMIHTVITMGIFLWLTIWGAVCILEARAKGENLISFG